MHLFVETPQQLDMLLQQEFHQKLSSDRFLNRIDLETFRNFRKKFSDDRSLCKKSLDIYGNFRLDSNFVPQFGITFNTEKAGEIPLSMDDPTMFGGGGLAISPILVCMSGFGGCFSAAFAKWSAMEGIKLTKLKISAKADVNFTTPMGIKAHVPMVDHYRLDLNVESNASTSEMNRVVELTKERCFCYYCSSTILTPKISLNIFDPPTSIVQSTRNSHLNHVNVENFKLYQQVCKDDLSICNRNLFIEGKWLLGATEGPQFETHVPTENVGTLPIKTDETTPLGGGGTSFHPVNLCMAGFGGSFAANFARWAALENIELFGLSIKMNQKIDLTTGFGIEPHIPMVDDYNVEMNVVCRESQNTLQEILNRCKERDFCYNCLTTSTVPEVILHHYQQY